MSSQIRSPPARLHKTALSTMFEESDERCFICMNPCKGLYCSSECRMQDKGLAAIPPSVAPFRLTAQLPPSLSPLARPVHHISPSPKMPGQAADTSSTSSVSSSPLHSPRTNPSASDSPQKESFNLPPPAYPGQSLQYGSIPVKIPPLVARPAPVPVAHSSSFHPGSIETLRFGRKPSVTNSVTSPNALLPRCACGKPANHKSRPASKDRSNDLDSGFSRLSLGPSMTTPMGQSDKRMVSDTVVPSKGLQIDRRTTSGHGAPACSSVSLLSRSRSDPIPPSPIVRNSPITPMTATREVSAIAPNRRASGANDLQKPSFAGMSRTSSGQYAKVQAVQAGGDDRRGRSRERLSHARDQTPSRGAFDIVAEREGAPSRSRHRREERQRAGDKDAEKQGMWATHQTLPGQPAAMIDPPQIVPSFREKLEAVANGRVERVVPRRTGSGANSPRGPPSPREEERRRAKGEIDQALGGVI